MREETADQAEEAEVGTGRPRRRLGRRALRLAIVAVLAVGGIVLLVQFLTDRWSHVYIVDSRIGASLITLSSEVSGQVTRIPVVTGDRVASGALLIGIDPRRVRLELEEIDAAIAQLDAEQSQLRAQQEMIKKTVASKLEGARAQLSAAEADHRASQAELESARSEYERVRTLRRQGVATAQRHDQTRADFLAAEQHEQSAAAGIVAAGAARAQAVAEESEITVLDRRIATLEAEKSAQAARRSQKLLDLGKREIRAEFDGVIDQVFINEGEYVAPGKRLLMYHDPTKVWVDANVKETEFRRLVLGAPARIQVDAYPDREFHGEVIRLGNAATSQFALIPSPNPSGNFTKVTQRLPVRIRVDQSGGLLRPGMMVEVTIDVVD